VAKTFPALTCARFTHLDPIRDLAVTYDDVYSAGLPMSDPAHAPPFVLADYGSGHPGASPEPYKTQLLFPIPA